MTAEFLSSGESDCSIFVPAAICAQEKEST